MPNEWFSSENETESQYDKFVKSRKTHIVVIPAGPVLVEAGRGNPIKSNSSGLQPQFIPHLMRGGSDGLGDFLRDHHTMDEKNEDRHVRVYRRTK